MKGLAIINIALMCLCSCGSHERASYMADMGSQAPSNSTDLLAFNQIKAPNYLMPNSLRSAEIVNPEALINAFPYLASTAPYYCDPWRFPPNVVLAMYSCQPYMPQILQLYSRGF